MDQISPNFLYDKSSNQPSKLNFPVGQVEQPSQTFSSSTNIPNLPKATKFKNDASISTTESVPILDQVPETLVLPQNVENPFVQSSDLFLDASEKEMLGKLRDGFATYILQTGINGK